MGQTEILYAENTRGQTITAIDLTTHKIVDTIDLRVSDPEQGRSPDDVITSRSGDTLYVSLMHNHMEGANAWPIYDPGELLALSVKTHEILWRVPLSGVPQHLTVSADDRFIYQPLYNWDYLEVVDVAKRAVVAKVQLGTYGSHGTRLSPDGKRLYVGTVFSDRITVVDTTTLKQVKTIMFPDAVRPFCMTRDERTLYVQLTGLHGFWVVDLATDTVTRKVDLPAVPPGTKPLAWNTVNHGMNMTRDDRLLFAAGSIVDYVCVYSLPGLKLEATIPVGKAPNWVIFSRDETLCLVSNPGDGTVSIISVADLKEIDRVAAGVHPQRMTTAMKIIA